MASAPTSLPVVRSFGETSRRDAWWITPLIVGIFLLSFVAYATWAAFQNDYYYDKNFDKVGGNHYLSPFYSPELWGASPHSWFGPKPAWWPGWLPFSPALLILPFPGLFRFTCYYYRGAYYKAIWSDPPSCAVGEWRKSYWGENSLPLIFQNVHRYTMYFALLFLVFLAHDAYKGMWFTNASGGTSFGFGVGTLVLTLNVCLLGGYTLGCHSFRHLVGGHVDQLTKAPLRHKLHDCSSCFNRKHMHWAWCSLIWVAFSDVYVRLCSMGIWTDFRFF